MRIWVAVVLLGLGFVGGVGSSFYGAAAPVQAQTFVVNDARFALGPREKMSLSGGTVWELPVHFMRDTRTRDCYLLAMADAKSIASVTPVQAASCQGF